MSVPIFSYGETEIAYLKKKDKALAAAIERIGPVRREVTPDLFEALVSSVVAQQISAKAAFTVWSRMRERFTVTPLSIVQADVGELQKCGISMKKAGYIKCIAEAVYSGALDIAGLVDLPDDEVCRQLVGLPGIGVWTAEMLMTFSMQRPDIVSWGDLAIRRGMMMLYHHRELDRQRFERYRRRYSPYGTVASLYLWEISTGK